MTKKDFSICFSSSLIVEKITKAESERNTLKNKTITPISGKLITSNAIHNIVKKK